MTTFKNASKLASMAVVAIALSFGALTASAKPVQAQTSFSFTLGVGDGARYYNPQRRSYYHYYYRDSYCQDYRRRFKGRAYNHYCYRGGWNARKDYRWQANRSWDDDRGRRHDRNDRWDRNRGHDGRKDGRRDNDNRWDNDRRDNDRGDNNRRDNDRRDNDNRRGDNDRRDGRGR